MNFLEKVTLREIVMKALLLAHVCLVWSRKVAVPLEQSSTLSTFCSSSFLSSDDHWRVLALLHSVTQITNWWRTPVLPWHSWLQLCILGELGPLVYYTRTLSWGSDRRLKSSLRPAWGSKSHLFSIKLLLHRIPAILHQSKLCKLKQQWAQAGSQQQNVWTKGGWWPWESSKGSSSSSPPASWSPKHGSLDSASDFKEKLEIGIFLSCVSHNKHLKLWPQSNTSEGEIWPVAYGLANWAGLRDTVGYFTSTVSKSGTIKTSGNRNHSSLGYKVTGSTQFWTWPILWHSNQSSKRQNIYGSLACLFWLLEAETN